MAVRTAIGLMSGTSLDGIDAAILKTDGEDVVECGPAISEPYSRAVKVFVRRAIKAALEGRPAAKDVADAEQAVTKAHIDAVRGLLDKANLSADAVDVIGFHGQTILHRPSSLTGNVGRTWQIGDGALLADQTGIDVVNDFRAADVAAGGEGAPFAPIYHQALARQYAMENDVDGPLAILNLGGVANITFTPLHGGSHDLVAFDCGPGNGLIDEWMEQKTGDPIDRDGKAAACGSVNDEALQLLLLNPYLKRPAPKSLDRYDFKLDSVKALSLTDGAATLTAFTAACIARSQELLPKPPALWIAAGGGRRNPSLMKALCDAVDAPVLSADEAGWRGDDLEAECFAYLAVRCLDGKPISFPKTTGVPHAMTGGVFHSASSSI
ncbi:MAG: anhydro-N-acetylmuramic acid kinase [Pseudomonadota bacterium]